MKQAIPVVAALAIASAAPALAQQEYRYPSDTSPPPQSREDSQRDQQARTPEADKQDDAGEIETLRSRSMSAPNVKGDAVPESPATGVPQPDAAGNPKSLESIPRP